MDETKINSLICQPLEIVRLILFKLEIKEVEEVCHINKYFKEKVCTNYFWRLYINKNWEDVTQALEWAVKNRNLRLIKILLKDDQIDPIMIYFFNLFGYHLFEYLNLLGRYLFEKPVKSNDPLFYFVDSP